ncbi:MAG: hypothetical protein WC109_09050 [Syntrophomonadaceae bacterium]|nr:hypothetical protein [Syntrophomonadaceae bacterium]MDD3271633.1 hypothetical protein [Syntrophomonadaceae bacterium]MDD3898302.1 hypothetical protein [Syntrophomonadaceae bacterium]MDD4562932.1 hypothetical protein [Syntrophomonadaceae bacterium]
MKDEDKVLKALATMQEGQNLIAKIVNELSSTVKELTGTVNKLTNEANGLRQDVVRMELQLTDKVKALFDGYESIRGTLTDHTQRLERIETKLETHEIQIKVLDSTKANKRKVK